MGRWPSQMESHCRRNDEHRRGERFKADVCDPVLHDKESAELECCCKKLPMGEMTGRVHVASGQSILQENNNIMPQKIDHPATASDALTRPAPR